MTTQKTIVRYSITWNGNKTNVYFSDHFEAADFFDECDRFEDKVIVHNYEDVTAEDIKADDTLSNAEMIEYLAILLLPNYKMFSKWELQEAEMKRLGLLA